MGRGARHHRGELPSHHGRVRPRECGGLRRHGPRGRHAGHLAQPDVPHVQLVLFPVGLRVLRAAHGGRGLQHRQPVSRDRLCRRPCRPLRRPGIRTARVCGHLGQDAACLQPRRAVRPCGGGPHAPRVAPHRGGPARHVACRARRIPPAPACRHRHGAGHGHAEHHHRGGPVRPRIRGILVLRLRAAGRARGRDAGREGGRDLRHRPGLHQRRGPHVRQRQAGVHCLGSRVRPEGQRHAAFAQHHLPHGHHGEPRRSGRADSGRRERGPERVGLRLQVHRRGNLEEDDWPEGIPGLREHHPERPRRPHPARAGNG